MNVAAMFKYSLHKFRETYYTENIINLSTTFNYCTQIPQKFTTTLIMYINRSTGIHMPTVYPNAIAVLFNSQSDDPFIASGFIGSSSLTEHTSDDQCLRSFKQTTSGGCTLHPCTLHPFPGKSG